MQTPPALNSGMRKSSLRTTSRRNKSAVRYCFFFYLNFFLLLIFSKNKEFSIKTFPLSLFGLLSLLSKLPRCRINKFFLLLLSSSLKCLYLLILKHFFLQWSIYINGWYAYPLIQYYYSCNSSKMPWSPAASWDTTASWERWGEIRH